jgi:lipid II:glycine glycyltransferase (peptidoglycan interpeptide bridge formation enzyme)
MPEVSLSDWNTFLKDYPNAHLLQTGEWGELKSAFGWNPLRIILPSRTGAPPLLAARAPSTRGTRTVDDGPGAQILFRRLPLGLTLAYMPKPVASGQLSVKNEQFWAEIDAACKRRRAVFLKVEPDSWDSETESVNRSHIANNTSIHNIQPPRTIIVDLHGTEDDILARMKQKTRYNIRLAAKKGVVVRPWDDLTAFHKMMLVTGGRDGFGVHSLEYYQRAYKLFHPTGMAELLVAEYENKPIAALMVFARGKRAWYVYGASTNEERNRMPTYLLQWEAMRWARTKGAEEYDLWGVPDEDEETLETQFTERNDGLWGVYRFKRGFGGELKRAAQALDRIYNPLLYKLYLWHMAGREIG